MSLSQTPDAEIANAMAQITHDENNRKAVLVDQTDTLIPRADTPSVVWVLRQLRQSVSVCRHVFIDAVADTCRRPQQPAGSYNISPANNNAT